MLFFKKILNTKSETVEQKDKRLNNRYPVGANFPIKANVRLIGRDEMGEPLAQSLEEGRDWRCRLLDISRKGVSVGLSPSASSKRGDPAWLTLSLGEDSLTVPAYVAHWRVSRIESICGLAVDFPEPSMQKAFLQLVEPVAMVSEMQMVNPAKLVQDAPGLKMEQYTGSGTTRLSVWRDPTTKGIMAFEFQLADYLVRWSTGMEELDISRASGSRALSEAQMAEITWLFCLSATCLDKRVAPDVREYLGKLVSVQ